MLRGIVATRRHDELLDARLLAEMNSCSPPCARARTTRAAICRFNQFFEV